MTSTCFKLLGTWMNAIASAWNMGEADWVFKDGRSVAVGLWSKVFTSTENAQLTDDEKAQLATDAVVELAKAHGIDPKRHKYHGGF